MNPPKVVKLVYLEVFFFQYEVTEKFYITWGLGIQNYRYQLNASSPAPVFPSPEFNTTYSQHYIQLNVSAKYRIYKTLYVRAGIGADVLAENRSKSNQTCENCGNSFSNGGGSGNLREAMLPVTIGVGYELKLTDRLNLLAEMFGTASLTNALEETQSAQLIRKPLQLGFSLGVIRSF